MQSIITYDKFIQCHCVFDPDTKEEANVMEELGLSLNMNPTAC